MRDLYLHMILQQIYNPRLKVESIKKINYINCSRSFAIYINLYIYFYILCDFYLYLYILFHSFLLRLSRRNIGPSRSMTGVVIRLWVRM